MNGWVSAHFSGYCWVNAHLSSYWVSARFSRPVSVHLGIIRFMCAAFITAVSASTYIHTLILSGSLGIVKVCLLLGLMCIFQALAGLKCVLLCKRGSVRFGNLCRHFSVSVNFSRLC